MQLNRTLLLAFLGFLSASTLRAQSDTILFTPQATYLYPGTYSAYTARFDRLGRHFIYTANKEYGLIVFDCSNPEVLQPVRTLPVEQFQQLKPTDLTQQGNYLYVSLGGFDGLFPQKAGLAIVDITDPANATLTGQWSDAAFNKGAAAILVEGDYAYLGAMEKGVIIVDVSKPDSPNYVSHLVPDINWPAPPGIFSVPHARGFALRNDELWTCFDAGGLRLIDVSDKQHPVEKSRYINTQLDAVAQPAYNTARIAGNHLFAAVDYCGLDVVDITDAANPAMAAWVNPWNCNNTNWDGSSGHTNQVATACHDSLLFLSGADSEVLAYGITNPLQPRRQGQYAVLHDSIATWGIDVNDSLVVLAQIWNPLQMPYIAKKGGIRLLRWICPKTTGAGETPAGSLYLNIFPNPLRETAQLVFDLPDAAEIAWTVFNAQGQPVLERQPFRQEAGKHTVTWDTGQWPAGPYVLAFRANGRVMIRKMLKA
ncbi:MAG: T9SS type A sorting domain-containing protein [Saprospirales bacterium]|nr:T9SS type A sorting domain-containing protein [Saprospirales bacterium]